MLQILNLVLFISFFSGAAPNVITVTSKTEFKVTNLFEQDGKIPSSGLAKEMALTKKAFFNNQKTECLKGARSIGQKMKSISHWAHIIELKCAMMGKPSLSDLNVVVARVKKNESWLFSSHFAVQIREPYLAALIERAKLMAKSQRVQAWAVIDEAMSLTAWMSNEREAELYEIAGEISFVDQDLLASKDYFEKSLRKKDSAKLRLRLDSILVALRAKDPAPVKQSDLGFIRGPRASKDEITLFERMKTAVASKDFLSAIDDGVQLLIKFPGGDHAKETEDQISSLLTGLMLGSDQSWDQIRSRVLRSLKKVEGDRLLNWSKSSFRRGKYRESLELSEAAAEKLSGQVLEGEALSIAAQSAHASQELKLAAKYYRLITDKFTGASYFYESLFRLGLVEYREKDFPEAVAAFEKLLSSQGGEVFEYRALYWTWRSLQKLKLERAKDLQNTLIEKYPMTLYGMIALAERSDQLVKLSDENKGAVVKISLRLLPDQKQSWDRLKILIEGGWLEEAQSELDHLPQPQTSEEHLIYSKLYSMARGYVKAINLMNKAWELNPEYAYHKDYLLWIFPEAFQKEISTWSLKREVPSVWIKSLIRQESAFNPRAVSRSNALGLMQLLPGTAQEVANDFKKPPLRIPESLFDSGTNVELGTTYLKRMVTRYKGQLPFALAAYNAGPTRLSRWLESSGVAIEENDLWVDEMPWSETSYYVKAILRNILIFQILDQGQLKISPPIWQISPKSE